MDARGILLRACKQNKERGYASRTHERRKPYTRNDRIRIRPYTYDLSRIVRIRAFFRSVPSFASRGGHGKERGRHSLVEVVDDGGACGIAAFLDGA